MRYWDLGDWVFLFVLFLVAVGFAVYYSAEHSMEYQRLMQQCLSDGHKEYECVSMLIPIR